MSFFSGCHNVIDKIKERISFESKPSVYRFAASIYAELNEKHGESPDKYPINFTLGSPTAPIYNQILDKGIEFLEKAKDKVLDYTNFQGSDELRTRIVKAFEKEHGLEAGKYGKDNAIFTVGANGAVELVLEFSKGIMGHKKVLLNSPTFGSYIPMIKNAGLEASLMDTSDDGYAIKVERMDKALTEMMGQEKSRIKSYIDGVNLIKQNIAARLPDALGDIETQTGLCFSKEQKNFYQRYKHDREKDPQKLSDFFDSIDQTLKSEKNLLQNRLDNIKPETYSCLFLLSDPGNPTGKKQSPEDLDDVAKLLSAKWKSVIVCGDHLYRDLTYPGNSKDTLFDREVKNPSLNGQTTPDNSLLNRYLYIDSFSKADGFASERCGTVFSEHPEFMRALANKQLQKGVHPSHNSQQMYTEAMEVRHNYVDKNADIYAKKMDIVSSGMVEIGVVDPNKKPNSAFYFQIDQLDFMHDLKLTQKELSKIKEFNPGFSSDIVGKDSLAASVAMSYRTHVVATAMYNNPEMEHVDYVGNDGKIPEQKATLRLVPTPDDKHLVEAVTRISEFKKQIEMGNVDYSYVETPASNMAAGGSQKKILHHGGLGY